MEMMPSDANEAVALFMRAWNTDETAERLMLLKTCCAPEAEFSSAQSVIRGLEPFNASIGAFLRTYPRARVTFGAPDLSQGSVRVRWRTEFNDGTTQPILGDDVMTLDANMRIVKVVSFDGKPADA
jgi:hypothetical protein